MAFRIHTVSHRVINEGFSNPEYPSMAIIGFALYRLTIRLSRIMERPERTILLSDEYATEPVNDDPNRSALRLRSDEDREIQELPNTVRERHYIRLLLFARPAMLLWYGSVQ